MEAEGFDPRRYLTRVGGADYLEVKWRVYWLRTLHPDAEISTELYSHQGESAVFKARVAIPGGGSSTGWGSETKGDFRDYLEKAETKALGRALAALGYGTQFTDDYDFASGGPEGKVVDAPVRRARERQVEELSREKEAGPPARGQMQRASDVIGGASSPVVYTGRDAEPMTTAQKELIPKMVTALGKPDTWVDDTLRERYQTNWQKLNIGQAKNFLLFLQKLTNEAGLGKGTETPAEAAPPRSDDARPSEPLMNDKQKGKIAYLVGSRGGSIDSEAWKTSLMLRFGTTMERLTMAGASQVIDALTNDPEGFNIDNMKKDAVMDHAFMGEFFAHLIRSGDQAHAYEIRGLIKSRYEKMDKAAAALIVAALKEKGADGPLD